MIINVCKGGKVCVWSNNNKNKVIITVKVVKLEKNVLIWAVWVKKKKKSSTVRISLTKALQKTGEWVKRITG